jgi:hypothetical protein
MEIIVACKKAKKEEEGDRVRKRNSYEKYYEKKIK